ncbi:uncharacterized protein BT62DRAFT_1070583 [Guyanagaster necrorhizus]|uniref:Uncharacterized protein n=1 Tax=Guyanagaster necrorhizus TaxID=856835 RepID=A0A9P8AYP7_9AGAR|nr:uncharacterized protein BT62DRAFT_1070583 [Guyanagaster necrorhizus MCA 3950]KAG7452868.1 hypothetical protein BT62DRAFT_1070583 [Guyanagaster necrorhizus MCA 3950]
MIIEEKCMHPPPPPYLNLSPPPPFTPSESLPKQQPALGSLPPHLLLQIVYCTFPQRDGTFEGEGKIERQRMTLYWLVTSLRLVNKTLYVACMHILRSTYLPAYNSLIRAPYTTDPFPSSSMPSAETTTKPSIFSTHRELSTLDLFIALLAHEDLMLDSTSLHLPREEAYKDLFDMVQPKTRLEDLVIEEGVQAGVIQVAGLTVQRPSITDRANTHTVVEQVSPTISSSPTPSSSGSSPAVPPSPSKSGFNIFSKSALKTSFSKAKKVSPTPPPQPRHTVQPLPSDYLSVSFTPKRVALVYTQSSMNASSFNGSEFGALSMSVSGPTGPGGRRKTIVEVVRDNRDEPLEVCARNLVVALREWLEEGD